LKGLSNFTALPSFVFFIRKHRASNLHIKELWTET